MIEHIKIPAERIGALIGPEGSIKELIEQKSTARLNIDSETGSVELMDPTDPLRALRGSEVIKAIARGFSPEKALRLFDDDLLTLDILDLTDIIRSEKDLVRIKGRIIGKNGKTRQIFEEMTGIKISVYGKTICLLGHPDQNIAARQGIEMLLKGSPHGPVYSFLEKKRMELKRAELDYV